MKFSTQTIWTDGQLVLYDITSSYMEGEYTHSTLVDFGYKDGKHEQIVIGLICNKEGYPVRCRSLQREHTRQHNGP